MDHITKTPLRVNDEVAHISKSSPTIFWLKSFFPAALGQETIVKNFSGFRHLTKKIGFFNQDRKSRPL